RVRGAVRHPLRHQAARRAASLAACAVGAGGRRQARLRPDNSPAEPLCDQHGTAMIRQRGLALALLVVLACGAGPARGDGVVADLSSHLIAITTGFTGASVVRFGATEGRGDIITVVRGPEREMTVWRKGKVAGIWVNAEAVVFGNVPSFYAVAASRPVDEIIAPGPAALYRIGTGNL